MLTSAMAVNGFWYQQQITNQDFNAFKKAGTYNIVKPTGANKPSVLYGLLLVFQYANHVLQVASPHTGQTLFFRVQNDGGVWNPWRKIMSELM
jgi:hypothetical protein